MKKRSRQGISNEIFSADSSTRNHFYVNFYKKEQQTMHFLSDLAMTQRGRQRRSARRWDCHLSRRISLVVGYPYIFSEFLTKYFI